MTQPNQLYLYALPFEADSFVRSASFVVVGDTIHSLAIDSDALQGQVVECRGDDYLLDNGSAVRVFNSSATSKTPEWTLEGIVLYTSLTRHLSDSIHASRVLDVLVQHGDVSILKAWRAESTLLALFSKYRVGVSKDGVEQFPDNLIDKHHDTAWKTKVSQVTGNAT